MPEHDPTGDAGEHDAPRPDDARPEVCGAAPDKRTNRPPATVPPGRADRLRGNRGARHGPRPP